MNNSMAKLGSAMKKRNEHFKDVEFNYNPLGSYKESEMNFLRSGKDSKGEYNEYEKKNGKVKKIYCKN